MSEFLWIAGGLLAWSALVVLVLGLFRINKPDDEPCA
jgi:hypothetical protein